MFDRHSVEEALAAKPVVSPAAARVTVPHSLAIPALLRGSDMLSIVAELAGAGAGTQGGELLMLWLAAVCRRGHGGHGGRSGIGATITMPAHLWLREQLAELAGAQALSFRA